MAIDDEFAIYASIPRPHLPEGQTKYASDYWPDRFNRPAYRPTPEVDPEILRTMKIVGTVGYARNTTNVKRNQVSYPNVKASAKDMRGERDERDGGARDPALVHPSVPKAYRKVAIKLGKMGVDDFDFDRYNRTGFCGLEASLPNSYCNAMLQILYFTEKLRVLMLNHTCNRENCVCCELSFLFHMMDLSPAGTPCQSGNFLRAMRTIPEASALGLIFPDQNAVWKANVPRLIQSWNRFILQQLMAQSSSKDDAAAATSSQSGSTARGKRPSGGSNSPMKSAPPLPQPPTEEGEAGETSEKGKESPKPTTEEDSLFGQLFGLKQEKVNLCSKCKTNATTKDTILLCNLVYPDNVKERTAFEQIVCSSLCPEQGTPAWCEKCRRYQPTHQTRNLR